MLVVGDRESSGRHGVGAHAQRAAIRAASASSAFIASRATKSRQGDAASSTCAKPGLVSQGGGFIAFDRSPRRDDRMRVNERIRVREIRVIDDTGAAARHHAAAAGAGHRQAEGTRPGRDLADGRAAGLPDHGLREIPVPGAEARARGEEAPEGDRGQRDQVPPEGRRARLPVQEEAHRALPRGRRQGQGDDLLPRPRDGAPGDRAAHSRTADRGTGRGRRSPRRCRGWKATRCTPS